MLKQHRTRRALFSILIVGFLCLKPTIILAHEISGYAAGEIRLFPNEALFPGQSEQSASFAFQPEYYHEFKTGSSFTFVPFVRVDSGDRERTHFDIRELTFLLLKDELELRVGVRKVFWGATEVLHLVDIINQIDLVENIDTEDRLGQPMVNLSVSRDWGTVDVFWMPFFRERTFQGTGGRLRGATLIKEDRVQYESAAEEWHGDWAFRYSHTFDDLDLGLSQFIGTNREPTLLKGTDSNGSAIFIPRYEQINQTSLDATYVVGDWLWKLESLYRTGQGNDDFFAWTGGFEYTFVGAFDSDMDLGIIGEWMFDTREQEATNAFENDIVTGLRLAVNDAASTEALFGWVQDLDTSARFLFLEASRRFGDNWLLTAELRAFLDQPAEDFFFDQRDDEIMQIDLAYYF